MTEGPLGTFLGSSLVRQGAGLWWWEPSVKQRTHWASPFIFWGSPPLQGTTSGPHQSPECPQFSNLIRAFEG